MKDLHREPAGRAESASLEVDQFAIRAGFNACRNEVVDVLVDMLLYGVMILYMS